ncbi:MAG: SAM-dependent methyltransferase [Candidatus Nanopelagicales bacterium]|nr:SAM-dependent methyltransferase [Candidatus Nanopelagicales bacterium]
MTEHPTIASDDLLSRLIFAHAEENPNDDDVVQHSWDTARAVLGSLESGEFPEALAAAPNALAEWETIASEPHKWPELASRLLIAMMGRQDGGLFTTPASLTRLMSACVQAIYARRKPSQVNVLDFACGTGSLLLEVCTTLADCGHEVVAYGCDVNESAVETARAALQRTGIANQVRVGNILQESPFDPESIDLVVVDPPASVRLTQEERATLRGLLGEFRGSSGSHAFAARAMQMLKSGEEGGTALITVPASFLHRSGSVGTFRREAQDRDWLRASVSLPGRLRSGTPWESGLIILETQKPSSWKHKSQVIDLRSFFEKSFADREPVEALTEGGIDEVTRALSRPRSTRFARAVGVNDVLFRNTQLSLELPGERRIETNTLLPAQESPEEWFRSVYGTASRVEFTQDDKETVVWSPSTFIDRPWGAPGDLRKPLMATTVDARMVSSGRGDEPIESASTLLQLVIPYRSADAAFLVTDDWDDRPCPRGITLSLETNIDPAYLVAWLNTEEGRQARRSAWRDVPLRALITDTDKSTKWQLRGMATFLNALTAPIVPLEDQHRTVRVLEVADLTTAQARLLRQQAWSQLDQADLQARRLYSALSESSDAYGWSHSLPYPLASALWTVRAYRAEPGKANRQLRLFFEAVTEFLATHLMSSLRSDPVMWGERLGELQKILQKAGLDFSRSTFGTWRMTVEYLSKVFRDLLASDAPDDAELALRLLGAPSLKQAERLLDPAIVGVISDANSFRNELDSHYGTLTTQDDLRSRQKLETLLQSLQAAFGGDGWCGMEMVRIKHSALRGGIWTHVVDKMTGPTTPFAQEEIMTMDACDVRYMHLVSPQGGVVELLPFVTMGSEPPGTNDTAYFFNRVTPKGEVRRLAYQQGHKTESLTHDPELLNVVNELDGKARPE